MKLPGLEARPSRAERPSLATVSPTDLGLGSVARDMKEVASEMEETRRLEQAVTDAEAEERARPLLDEVATAYEADFAERGAAWDGISPGFARDSAARFEHFFGPFALREDLDPATQAAVTRGVAQMRVASGQRAVQYMTQRRGGLEAQRAQARQGAEVGAFMGDYMTRLAKGRAELDAGYDGSTPDYAGRLTAVHDAAAAAVLEDVPEHLRPLVQQRLDGQRLSLLGQGLDAEARAEGAYVVGQVKTTGEALVNSVIGAPQQWESARAEVDAVVAPLPAGTRGATRAGLLDDLATARIEGLIQAGQHDQAVELLTSGAMDADLSPASKARLLGRAQQAADALSVDDYVARFTLEGRVDDNLASLRMTGVAVSGAPSVDEVAAAFGPAAGAKYAIDLAAAADAASNRPAFGQMSEGQIEEWLAARRPVPGQTGFAEAQAAYEQADRAAREEVALRKDPAAWALRQAPPLGGRLEAALGGDRGQARDFAVGSLTLQARAGIPAQDRRILPEPVAKRLVGQVEGVDRREGLLQVGGLVAAFAPPAGASGEEAWAAAARQRMVVNELVEAGLDPDLLAAGVDLTGDEARMGAYVRAKAGGGLNALDKDAKTAVEAGVARELRPWLASFEAGGVSGYLNQGRVEMTEMIAADLVARGRRPADAAREAARIVTGPYVFVGAQGVRVPRQQAGDREAEGQLTRGMSRTVQTYLANDGALLRIPDDPAWRNLTPEQRADRWTDAVAANGRWFTTPDEGGAVLMVPGRDGRWDPVLAVDGSAVAVTWRQLKVAGRQRLAAGNDVRQGLGGNPSGQAPLGVRNHNPGNLRPTGERWRGQTGENGGFMTFATPQHGIRALAVDLTSKHGRGLRTVRQIIRVYAPPGENDTDAYVRHVARALGVDPDAPLDFSGGQLEGMMGAIIQMENGQQPYPQAMIQEGARLARSRQ